MTSEYRELIIPTKDPNIRPLQIATLQHKEHVATISIYRIA